MKKITLEAVAKQAGVGIATVDRVINERGGVSPATTRRVLQAAKEAGLKRELPDAHRQPWQIELLLSSSDAFSSVSFLRISAGSPGSWAMVMSPCTAP